MNITPTQARHASRWNTYTKVTKHIIFIAPCHQQGKGHFATFISECRFWNVVPVCVYMKASNDLTRRAAMISAEPVYCNGRSGSKRIWWRFWHPAVGRQTDSELISLAHTECKQLDTNAVSHLTTYKFTHTFIHTAKQANLFFFLDTASQNFI